MNDTEATLLSRAYENPSTRISLIWGTGCNAALIMPLAPFAEKVKNRPSLWTKGASTIVVNTEASMFGAGVLPQTEADRRLDAAMDHPGFQPLEQMTSGRYLGEISRLLVIKGVESGELFGGSLPPGLRTRFGVDAEVTAELEK